MVELLSRLNAGDLTMVLLVPTVALVAGVVAIALQVIRAYQRNRERETASAVVAEMLDRGMGSEEIIAVLKAMGLEKEPESQPSVAESPDSPAARFWRARRWVWGGCCPPSRSK